MARRGVERAPQSAGLPDNLLAMDGFASSQSCRPPPIPGVQLLFAWMSASLAPRALLLCVALFLNK